MNEASTYRYGVSNARARNNQPGPIVDEHHPERGRPDATRTVRGEPRREGAATMIMIGAIGSIRRAEDRGL